LEIEMGRHLRVERNSSCHLTCPQAFEKAVLERIGSNLANGAFQRLAKHCSKQPLSGGEPPVRFWGRTSKKRTFVQAVGQEPRTPVGGGLQHGRFQAAIAVHSRWFIAPEPIRSATVINCD
jgi:hypothetical protein